ncbi:hypothetical protein FF38_07449 [Lucilia cuprina]|uniref:Uncharacterized protein n=1 Tax=Lucilia cuprina TaxID=7375 RepID=A0A0L0CDX2_LUCCU|nr:hypothetical protein FF38_07449 [Lucilia cuprina]
MRHGKGGAGGGTFRDKLLSGYQGLDEHRSPEMDSVLEQALKEAEEDVTFKKVKRMSYSSNAAGELTQRLAKLAGLNKTHESPGGFGSGGSRTGSRMNSMRGSRKVDLKALDKLVNNLLEQQSSSSEQTNKDGFSASTRRKSSMKLNRWRPTSRSAHSFNINEGGSTNYAAEHSGGGSGNMPTIMESTVTVNNQHLAKNNNETTAMPRSQRSSWSSSLERTPGAVRNVLRNINGGNSEENLNLAQNYQP